MLNASSTNQNIVYLNYKTSGLASVCTDTTVVPNTASSITKGQIFVAGKAPIMQNRSIINYK